MYEELITRINVINNIKLNLLSSFFTWQMSVVLNEEWSELTWCGQTVFHDPHLHHLTEQNNHLSLICTRISSCDKWIWSLTPINGTNFWHESSSGLQREREQVRETHRDTGAAAANQRVWPVKWRFTEHHDEMSTAETPDQTREQTRETESPWLNHRMIITRIKHKLIKCGCICVLTIRTQAIRPWERQDSQRSADLQALMRLGAMTKKVMWLEMDSKSNVEMEQWKSEVRYLM